MYFALGAYQAEAESTPELGAFVAFFFIAFGNSIGNI
jgi:hypothetical protein